MITSFLEKATTYIRQHHQDQMGQLCILLPTRRSVFILREVLKIEDLAEEKRPKCFSMEDFVETQANTKRADQVTLLLELQEIFKQQVGLTQDNLMSWLPTLLRDFHRIDQYMVAPDQLFRNLADVGRVQQWNMQQNDLSETVAHYFQFWDDLHQVYKIFNANLAKKGLAYLGAMYRSLAQQVEQKLLHHEVYKHYLFVGFNALNKAEEQIIRKLLKAKKATVLWDSDRYFMEAHTENQAGKFLKKYKKDATLTPNEWLWEEDLLLNTEKEVVTIATNNAVMQAKVAQQLLREWGVPQKPISTGIILPDENLLLPTMYALDIPEINITMGLSLQRSTLYNLINTLFEMHQTAKHTTKEIEVEDDDGQKQLKTIQLESYYYKHIIKVLNHPFIRKYEQLHENTQGGISFIRDAISYMVRFNVVSLSSGELMRLPDYLLGFKEADEKDTYFFQYEHFKPLLRVIFQRWGERNATEKAIKTLQSLCGFFERFYSKSNALEKHYVRKFKEIMQTLQQTLKARKYNVDIRTLKVFIYQLIREERIAFDSERNSAVQIMGMLETRTLDFEQLIILSSNEKTLPPAKKATSLIPVDIATAFGLPTHTEQDAVMSYHFYRLLQRASRVALLYVNPSKTYGGEEKSRFILQIENDLVKRSQGKIKFSQKAAFADQALSNPSPDLVIEKSPAIEAAILENLAEGLSPTHIDTFLKCSLRYYFEHIAGIQDAENVEEELGTDKFGVLVHEILEDLFRELAHLHSRITIDTLEAEKDKVAQRVLEKFQDKKYKGYHLIGNNYIAQQMAMKHILDFLDEQIEELTEEIDGPKAYFEILGLEARKQPEATQNEQFVNIAPAEFHIRWKGEKIPVRIKGIIDRIDRLKDTIRIIDYKTGKVEAKQVKVKPTALTTHDTQTDVSKARQLWIYRYIVLKNFLSNPQFSAYKEQFVMAGIYSLPNLKAKLLPLSFIEKEDRFPANALFLNQTEKLLEEIVLKILDPAQPFKKTDDLAICQYCDFKTICGRHS